MSSLYDEYAKPDGTLWSVMQEADKQFIAIRKDVSEIGEQVLNHQCSIAMLGNAQTALSQRLDNIDSVDAQARRALVARLIELEDALNSWSSERVAALHLSERLSERMDALEKIVGQAEDQDFVARNGLKKRMDRLEIETGMALGKIYDRLDALEAKSVLAPPGLMPLVHRIEALEAKAQPAPVYAMHDPDGKRQSITVDQLYQQPAPFTIAVPVDTLRRWSETATDAYYMRREMLAFLP